MKSSSDSPGLTQGCPIAVFDFDGTLTYCDTLLPFLRACAGALGFWAGLAALLPAAGRALTTRSRDQFKAALLQRFLRGRSTEELRRVTEVFCDRRIPALMNDAMLARLEWHQREGHRVILLSASPDFYLRVWARRHGIQEVIATEVEFADGVCTGRLGTENCRGNAKVRRLDAHCGTPGLRINYAYGDSPADRALLARAVHAAYRAHRSRGYAIRSLVRLARAII